MYNNGYEEVMFMKTIYFKFRLIKSIKKSELENSGLKFWLKLIH